MILGVPVEEHAELQKRIWAIFDSWHHATWREGSLLYITMEVLWVLVQSELAEIVHLDSGQL